MSTHLKSLCFGHNSMHADLVRIFPLLSSSDLLLVQLHATIVEFDVPHSISKYFLLLFKL